MYNTIIMIHYVLTISYGIYYLFYSFILLKNMKEL